MREGFGLTVPENIGELSDPRWMALVVYDMQVGVVGQLPDGPQITARVLEVVRAARAGGYRVFFTRHMSLPLKLMGVSQLRTAMAWQNVDDVHGINPMFLRDSPAFELVPELTPEPDEAVFDKISMSAFAGTPLDIALRDCGITTVALAGVALEVGIAPTVWHATDLGYIPVVVTDACGGRDQAAQTRVLDAMRFTGDAILTNRATLCPLLQKPPTQHPAK
jgi:nicotinamidase-related amidase